MRGVYQIFPAENQVCKVRAIYTPLGLPLTVSILSVRGFHLKRMMHLEHGQMSQRGQLLENSNTARQTQGTKLDIFSGEMRMRDFFFHENNGLGYLVLKSMRVELCFSSLRLT